MSGPLVTHDPASVALFRLDRAQLPQYLTREQVHTLVEHCRRPRDRMFVRIAFETGARVSEILQLAQSDVDLANRQIRLVTLKRRTDRRRREVQLARWIPVSAGLCADLGDWFIKLADKRNRRHLGSVGADNVPLARFTEEPRLFPHSRQAMFNTVRHAGERAGLVARGGRKISPHILRHSFAMNCINQGVPINVVKELLGHSSITNTMVYLKTAPAEAREFLAKVHF